MSAFQTFVEDMTDSVVEDRRPSDLLQQQKQHPDLPEVSQLLPSLSQEATRTEILLSRRSCWPEFDPK